MPDKPDILLTSGTLDVLNPGPTDHYLTISPDAFNGMLGLTSPTPLDGDKVLKSDPSKARLGILGIDIISNPLLPEGTGMLVSPSALAWAPHERVTSASGEPPTIWPPPADVRIVTQQRDVATPIVSDDVMNIEAAPASNRFVGARSRCLSSSPLPESVDAAITDLLQAAEAHSIWAPDYGDITTSTATTTEPLTIERYMAAMHEFQAKMRAEILFVQGTRLDIQRFKWNHFAGGYGCKFKVVGTEEDEVGRVLVCKGDWPLDVLRADWPGRVEFVDVLPQEDIERLEKERMRKMLEAPLFLLLDLAPVKVEEAPQPKSARERYGRLLERMSEIDADPNMREATEAEVDELDAILAEGLAFHDPADFLGEE